MAATQRKTLDQTAARGALEGTDLLPTLPVGAQTLARSTVGDLVAFVLENGAATDDLANVDPATGRAALGVNASGIFAKTVTTEPAGTPFGDQVSITNPTGKAGYAVRLDSYKATGNINSGGNDIGQTFIGQWSSIQNATAWGRWDVVSSPLGFGSGFTGAPGVAQSFYMVSREINPQNRAGDPGGWKPEARLWGGTVVAGEQMVAETQDFSALLGNLRVGYNIAFGYTINHSPFAANIGGTGNRHARFYNGFLVHPNAIAPAGYGVYIQGYRPFVAAVAISAAGSGYAVGNLLTFNTGLDLNFNENTVLKVLTVNGSGAITSVEILSSGGYLQGFATPIGVTGGVGTGATFTYTLSTTAEAPAAAIGISGTFAYGIDFMPGANALRELQLENGAIRVPSGLQVILGRNAANSADVSVLAWNGDDSVSLAGENIAVPRAWAPTLSADSGAFTTIAVVDANYAIINGWCHFTLNVHVTTKGSAAGALRFTEPVPPKASVLSYMVAGMNATTGVAMVGRGVTGSGIVRCALYSAADPLADATFYTISGAYEIA